MKKLLFIASVFFVSVVLFANQWEDSETGLVWNYEQMSSGEIRIVNTWRKPVIIEDVKGGLIVPSLIPVDGKMCPVTEIGDWAFYNCRNVTSIQIQSGLKRIGSYAFWNCRHLIHVDIPDSVTEIGGQAFFHCHALKTVKLPSLLSELKDIFYECNSLVEVEIPDFVQSIDSLTFRKCINLRNVTIGKGVKYIGDAAFFKCFSLQKIRIPESVTEIAGSAFMECVSLHEVWFDGKPPKGVGEFRQHHYLPMHRVFYPRKYAQEWRTVLGNQRLGITDVFSVAKAVIHSAKIVATSEASNPLKMEVQYSVERATLSDSNSGPNTVWIRPVAFVDGVRSFANWIPVKTVQHSPCVSSSGTMFQVQLGKRYTITWDIGNDWSVPSLSNVAMEILVRDGAILPKELMTIDGYEYPNSYTLTFARNSIPENLIFNALLWYCAEDSGLDITAKGEVMWQQKLIARAGSINNEQPDGGQIDEDALLTYLYGKEGARILQGKDLGRAESKTELKLQETGTYRRALMN